MHFLIIALQLLDLLALMLQVLYLTLALRDICSHHTRLLREVLYNAVDSLSTARTLPTPKPPPQNVLYNPAFALHQVVYDVIISEYPAFPRRYLEGSEFFRVVERLLAGEEVFGVKFEPEQLEDIEELASLPELVVTSPEDGDRVPERGQKGAKRVKYEEGLLAPPARVSKRRSKKRMKRREERKEKALEKASAS